MLSTDELETLKLEIKKLAPWHHNIKLNQQISTGAPFSSDGLLHADDNDDVSLISPQQSFLDKIELVFPEGLHGKRFLDCACNAGAYCFFARELGADFSFGFDVRDHWINQAQFVQKHRTCAPTDRIEFRVMDLLELSQLDLQPFDFTYFSGIFYHLPDPVAGLHAAAKLTNDVLLLSTAGMVYAENPYGMSLVAESATEVMSGVHNLAWLPNSAQTLVEILYWMGFRDIRVTKEVINPYGRRRLELLAAKTPDRFGDVGTKMESKVFGTQSINLTAHYNQLRDNASGGWFKKWFGKKSS